MASVSAADAPPASGGATPGAAAPGAAAEAHRARAEELLRRGSLHEAQAAIAAGEAAASTEHRRCGRPRFSARGAGRGGTEGG